MYQIYFSDDTWNELCAKLDSPKLSELIIKSKRNISRDELSHYLNLLFESSITRITVSRTIELCRDPDDDKFLELASEIQADYIISGDKDLLAIKTFEATKIFTPSEFRQIISSN
jgi:uncharacterized protein